MGGEWSSDSWCIKIYGLDQRKMEAFTHSFPEFQIAGNNHPTVDYMNFQYLFLTCPAQPTKIAISDDCILGALIKYLNYLDCYKLKVFGTSEVAEKDKGTKTWTYTMQ
ncbi:hypothetical protein Fcan01_19242 [Folsomia candida]|uniref:Uncharacterized protein n=1 Tax=Folsomia candida TaxID=158441 RepID=A0A226DMB9_FOLCA|nr:hypothetical protein Fcan01_19242 [Folsomia candida]